MRAVPRFSADTAIVAHDAGAANLILAWLDERDARAVTACFEGPARELWQIRFPDIVLSNDIEQAMHEAGRLVTGTGWQSDLEHRARCLARQRRMPSAAVIDHWVNYRQRFVRGDEECLPDEVWVGDSDARRIAQVELPATVTVREFENTYLARTAAAVRPVSKKGDVLYVAEPIIADWGCDGGEFIALDYFMAQRERAGITLDRLVRLRPHPAEPWGKYDAWVARHGHDVVLDDRADLVRSLGDARWVVGCHSFAMVVALAAGRTVISSLPPGSPPCPLPQQEIVHLRNIA